MPEIPDLPHGYASVLGEALDEVAARKDSTEITVCFAPLGRLLEIAWYVDQAWIENYFAIPRNAMSTTLSTANEWRDAVYAAAGAPWVMLEASLTGTRRQVWVDFDVRPGFDRWEGVAPEVLMGELMVTPRPSELTPAWMKVELATAGLWDVERDCSAWNDDWEPTGHPVTREVAEAAFAGQRPVAGMLFGAGGPPPGFSRGNPLVIE